MKTKSFNQLPQNERTKIMLSVALDYTLDAIKRDFHMKLQSGASIQELQDVVDTLDWLFSEPIESIRPSAKGDNEVCTLLDEIFDSNEHTKEE